MLRLFFLFLNDLIYTWLQRVKASLWFQLSMNLKLRPCGLSLRQPQGPDVRLPKIVTFRRGEVAARAVICPLTKTRRRGS